jgi:hypothetical protein
MHRDSIQHISDVTTLRECLIYAVDKIKILDVDMYNDMELYIYRKAYGDHVSEHLAHKWVDSMQNKDGSRGPHWSKSQTDVYAGAFDKNDWYVVLNMMYSDYYNSKFDTSTYIDLAKDWLSDKDSSECKLLKYYLYVVK